MESVLEGLILSPIGLNIPVEEVRPVGSFKKGTMVAGHPVADLVVILKETPSGNLKSVPFFYYKIINTFWCTNSRVEKLLQKG